MYHGTGKQMVLVQQIQMVQAKHQLYLQIQQQDLVLLNIQVTGSNATVGHGLGASP